MGVYYTGTFASTGYGDNLKWEIIGPSNPGNTAVTPSGRGHTQVTWQASEEDEFAPLMPSEARISFYDTVGDDVLTTMFAAIADQEYAYTLKITNTDTSAVVWIGYLETGAVERDEDGNKVMVLTATDGLRRLEEIYYTTDKTALTLYTGRVTVVALIADLLNRLGFNRDIYTACNLYPLKSAPQLAATADPLASVYVDRAAFRSKDIITKPPVGNRTETTKDATYYPEKYFAPIRCSEVLGALLRRFGLRIAQWNGAWHIIQQDLLYNGSYRRWHYDYAGVAQSPAYEDFTSGVTPTDENVERGLGTIASLSPYSAVRMDYRHGTTQILRNPDLDVDFRQGIAPWYSDGVVTPIAVDESNLGWKTEVIRYGASGSAPPNTQGSGAGSWDAIIQSSLTADTTGALIYDSAGIKAGGILVPTGTQMWPNVSFRLDQKHSANNDGSANTGAASNRKVVALQIKITDGGSNTHYLEPDGTWTTAVTWLLANPTFGYNSWIPLRDATTKAAIPTAALAYDAYVVVTLGPAFEITRLQGTSDSHFLVDSLVWDSAQLIPVVGGVYNPEITSTVNYVDRTRPKIKEVVQYLGDGPISASETGLSTNASGTIDGTSDWEQGAGHSGASTGDSIDDLLSRIHLRAQRYSRRKHTALYHGLDAIPGPAKVLVRSGSRYAPLSMTVDYAEDTVQGTWVKLVQAGFTDDLEVGVYSNGSGFGAWGGDGTSGFIMERLADTFFTEASKRVAVTTAVIAAGATTTLTVASGPDNAGAGIVEPLLKNDDYIVLIAPDLSYHLLRMAADQTAAATTITIDSYSFPVEIPYPASIFFVEDELLTLARLGEQGFAVTVQAKPIGKVNGNQSGTVTSLNVKEWIGSVDSGKSVYLESGVKLVLTADKRAGASSIAFTSTNVGTLLDDAPIFASGQVRRSEFLVTSDKITAYLKKAGDQIATVTAESNDTTIPVTAIPAGMDLYVGDYIYIHEVGGPNPGTVHKRMVSADAAATATSIAVSASIHVFVNDVIVPAFVTGMRLDADGITFRHTHIRSEGWNGTVLADGTITVAGTTGWIITALGDAEFNIVNARQRITVGTDVVINQYGITIAGSVATPAYATDPKVLQLGPVVAHGGVWHLGGLRDAGYIGFDESGGASVGYLTISGGNAAGGRLTLKGGGNYIQIDATGAFLGSAKILTDSAGLSGASALADPNADRLLFWDDSAGTVAWLTLGTNLSITGTTINATGASVATLDDVGDVALTAIAQGAILYRNGADEWANLPAGTSGYVLKTQGAGANPIWGTLAAADLSDGANVAHINATESISAAWTFGLGYLKLTNVTTGATTLNAGDAAGNITITLPATGGALALAGSFAAVSHTHSAADITSGTLDDARLSANVAHINAAETIGAAWQFGLGYMRLTNVTTGYTTLNAGDPGGNVTITLPATTSTLAALPINCATDLTNEATGQLILSQQVFA